MKKIFILILTVMLCQLNAFSQTESIDRFVRKVKRSNRGSDKIDLSIPGWLIRFGANFVDEDDLDGVDIKFLGKKISHLRVVTIENKNTVAGDDIKGFMSDAHKEGFEDLMQVRSEGNDIRFMIREKKDIIRNVVLMVNENEHDGDFVLLSIEGKFTMDDINKMIKDVNIDVNNSKSRKIDTKKTIKSEDE